MSLCGYIDSVVVARHILILERNTCHRPGSRPYVVASGHLVSTKLAEPPKPTAFAIPSV